MVTQTAKLIFNFGSHYRIGKLKCYKLMIMRQFIRFHMHPDFYVPYHHQLRGHMFEEGDNQIHRSECELVFEDLFFESNVTNPTTEHFIEISQSQNTIVQIPNLTETSTSTSTTHQHQVRTPTKNEFYRLLDQHQQQQYDGLLQ